MQRCGAVPVLGVLIDELDKFNKVAPGMTSEDADDLAWPGLTGKAKEYVIKFHMVPTDCEQVKEL